MKNNFKTGWKFLASGLFFLIIGLGLNKFTLVKLFPFLEPRFTLSREILVAFFNVFFSACGLIFIFLRHTPKKLCFSLIIFLFSVMILLAGGEILVKIFSSSLNYYPTTSPGNVYQFGPPTGIIFTPNYKGVHQNKDFRVAFEANSEGFRSSAEFLTGSESQKIVAVLGDSFTAGLGVDEKDTFVKLSESALAGQGIKQVQNYGMPGTGIAYYLQTYEAFVKKHKPAVVVIAVLYNDIPDFNYFQKSAYGFLNKADAFFQRHSSLYKFVYLQSERSKLETWQSFPKDGYLWESPPSSSTRKIYEGFFEKFSQLIDEIKQDGAVPVMTLVPSYIESSDEVWSQLEKSYKFVGGKNNLDRDMLRNELRTMAEKTGAVFIDPNDAFREAYGAGENLYYAYDHHFNQAGHKIMAGIISDKITEILNNNQN